MHTYNTYIYFMFHNVSSCFTSVCEHQFVIRLKGLADLSMLLVLLVAWFQMSFLWDSMKNSG